MDIEILDNHTEEELIKYFCKILGHENYEENPRDRDTKNIMLTAKLTARDLIEGKYLNKPPQKVLEKVNMGSLVRTSHRDIEVAKKISYKGNNLDVYKTTSFSTVGESEERYDYMTFLDLVKIEES